MNNHKTSKTNITNSQCGVSISQKITKRDAVVFSTLLMKCRSLDVGRRLQKDRKLTSPDIESIRRFCIQAIEDVHRMERGEYPEGFTPKKEVVSLMPLTISKNSGVTTYSIRNFTSLRINGITPIDIIDDNTGDEDDAILFKVFGPRMSIDLSWTITDEASSVVTGTGGSVTTAVAQTKYLYDTLMSKGDNQYSDEYDLTIDFGGGVTMSRPGHISAIDVIMTYNEPLTFSGSIRFEVGLNPMS